MVPCATSIKLSTNTNQFFIPFAFLASIFDPVQEVMRLVREFKCCAGCGWCANTDSCSFEVKVEAPVGNIVGYVKQSWVLLNWRNYLPMWRIYDSQNLFLATIIVWYLQHWLLFFFVYYDQLGLKSGFYIHIARKRRCCWRKIPSKTGAVFDVSCESNIVHRVNTK